MWCKFFIVYNTVNGIVSRVLLITHNTVYVKSANVFADSLGGNCKTSLITTITPVVSCYTESLSSLNFAKRLGSMFH